MKNEPEIMLQFGLEMEVFASQFAKEMDKEIIAAVIKEAETTLEKYMLSDDLFEI